MPRVPLSSARPGMRLAAPISARDGNLLVEEGAVLTPHLLDLLDLWGISSLDVAETGSKAPVERKKAPPPAVNEHKRSLDKIRVKDLGAWIHGEATNMLKEIEHHPSGIDAERLRRVATSIVDESTGTKEMMAALTTVLGFDTYLFAHSVHVAILSVITGIAMGVTRDELHTLATGGLLHDIGMLRVDQRIWQKRGALTDAEFEKIQKHPRFSLDRAEDIVSEYSDTATILLQHHERMDGSGYPDGTQGRLIHPLARIAAVCDTYEAMQAERSYRKKWLPYQVMSHLLVSSTETLDAEVVKAFLRTMSAYPIGSLVRLDSGQVGIVVSANAGSPIRPMVKIFMNLDHQMLERFEYVDLSNDARFIIGPMDPRELGIEPFEVF